MTNAKLIGNMTERQADAHICSRNCKESMRSSVACVFFQRAMIGSLLQCNTEETIQKFGSLLQPQVEASQDKAQVWSNRTDDIIIIVAIIVKVWNENCFHLSRICVFLHI